MSYSLEIKRTTFGGGQWAWLLWGDNREILAFNAGFPSHKAARSDWEDFQRAVSIAAVVLFKTAPPAGPKER